MLNSALYVAKPSYGLEAYIITRNSAEVNEPGYDSHHHARF